jgi:hypothetical protein
MGVHIFVFDAFLALEDILTLGVEIKQGNPWPMDRKPPSDREQQIFETNLKLFFEPRDADVSGIVSRLAEKKIILVEEMRNITPPRFIFKYQPD